MPRPVPTSAVRSLLAALALTLAAPLVVKPAAHSAPPSTLAPSLQCPHSAHPPHVPAVPGAPLGLCPSRPVVCTAAANRAAAPRRPDESKHH